jgi:hypothetical protein
MFTEFVRPSGNIFEQPVNSLIGSIFLGTCALWGAIFVWNVTTGSNPIDHVIASVMFAEADLK